MHKRINDGSKNKKKISYWSINADFYYLEYFQFQLLSQKLKRNPYNVAEKNGNLNIYSFMTTASAADDHVIWSFRMAANGPKNIMVSFTTSKTSYTVKIMMVVSNLSDLPSYNFDLLL